MVKQSRKLQLDIFDYNNRKLCSLYDNSSDVSGQAYDVFVITERNGWRELTFNLPYVIQTENGEEPNYRIDYIQPDYRIRLIDDFGTDWFLLTEPSFSHKGFTKSVSVKAGHIAQLLKTKNLGLEFTDKEGNNVGTAEQILETILKGTGWSVGHVERFYEKYETDKIKVRSLQAPVKTGAFKLISKMCDLFDAKPIFHGDTKTVDIVPINPFTKPNDGSLPDVTKANGVIELAYSNNVKNVTRKMNSENIVTKLYVYGSYGDDTNGYCGIEECFHKEYSYIVYDPLIAGQKYYFQFIDDSGITIYRNFTPDRNIPSGAIIHYSLLDPASQMYVWIEDYDRILFDDIHDKYWNDIDDDTWNSISNIANVNGYAYLVEQGQVGTEVLFYKEYEVKNWYPFIMDFEYFQEVNLLTNDNLQKIAGFQRFGYECYQHIFEKSLERSDALLSLSETIGDVDFCKLDVLSIAKNSTQKTVSIALNKNVYKDGIIYRSDYDTNKKKHFEWMVTSELKENGDPKTVGASMIFIIFNTSPIKWIKGYLKALDNEDDPNVLTFHISDTNENYNLLNNNTIDTTKFFLFGSNSISGWLGAFEAYDESEITALNSKTQVVTIKHDLKFGTELPSIKSITDQTASLISDNNPSWYKIDEYGWFWKFSFINSSELYFCYYDHYGDNTERTWRKVYFQKEEPNNPDRFNYWYNWETSKLYRYINDAWNYLETDQEKEVTKYFSSVYKTGMNRDKIYKGIYKYLTYTINSNGLSSGNYYIEDDYGYFYVFSLLENLSQGDRLRYDTDDSWIECIKNGDLEIVYTNQNLDLIMESGTINSSTGILENNTSKCRSEQFLEVIPGNIYTFSGLSSAFPLSIYKYNLNQELIGYITDVSGFDGTFIAESNVKYIKLGANINYQIINNYHDFSILNGSITTIASKSYRFDNVKYHPNNNYKSISESGSISNNGSILDSSEYQQQYCRTKGFISVYPNNTYNINNIIYNDNILNVSIHFYNSKNVWLSKIDNVSGNNGQFTTVPNAYYIKIVSYNNSIDENEVWSNVFNSTVNNNIQIRNIDYNKCIIIEDKNYYKLNNINKNGEVKGIISLIEKFSIKADEAWQEYYKELIFAQDVLENINSSLANSLGEIYREGYWQKSDYVDGDEDKLYRDAVDNLKKICRPEVSYNIDYLDLYESDQYENYYASELTSKTIWPDLSSMSAVHLIDPEININCWAYIDVVQKCYDKPWQTKINVNTELTTMTQHTFADVMANIADVASTVKAKDTLIDRAGVISSSGKMSGERLEGTVNAAKLTILGGSSNWYTDDKGNIVFESADGRSAMTLTGAGFAVANSKDTYGNWNYRTLGTGDGIVADEITTGILNAELIEAGSIVADQLSSSVGSELDISSNEAVILAAKSADHLITSYIDIANDHITISSGGNLNIESNGSLNLNGSTLSITGTTSLNIASEGDLSIEGAGKLSIVSGTVEIISDSSINMSSGIFNLFTTDENSRIAFGGTFNEPKFSLGNGGNIVAESIQIKNLVLDSNNVGVLYTSIDSLSKHLYVGENEPTPGNAMLWIKPIPPSSLPSELETVYTADLSNHSISGSSFSETFDLNTDVVLDNGTEYTYEPQFRIYVYSGKETCTNITISIVDSNNNTLFNIFNGIPVSPWSSNVSTFIDGTYISFGYENTINEPRKYLNNPIGHSTTNYASNNTIKLKIEGSFTNDNPNNFRYRFEYMGGERLKLRCKTIGGTSSSSNQSTKQQCELYYIP